jgi:hypothetical protein
MGYRGLLLNDPYKRDRIDGCMLDIFRFSVGFLEFLTLLMGYTNQRLNEAQTPQNVCNQCLLRAFMGYRGLLLNAPYKIDSIVWMRLM